ncbi:hypothetical protein AT729_01405 [Neisseria meningitidis]|nr:hypothetical protein AT729_01405 [Neisseria meningitidis]
MQILSFQPDIAERMLEGTEGDLCKIPVPPDSRNPNTGFRLFSPQIPPDFTQIPP